MPSDELAKLQNSIEADQADVIGAKNYWRMGKRRRAVAAIKDSLEERNIASEDDDIEQILESMFDSSACSLQLEAQPPSDPESELLAFRRAEFNVIRDELDDPSTVPDLRVVPADVPTLLTPWLSRVTLVEKLKETRVFYGFDRLQQEGNTLADMPDSAMTQLFRDPPTQPQEQWLPAVEVFGEGIYLELDQEHLRDWQSKRADWIADRINDGFLTRLAGISKALPPEGAVSREWASRYLVVHSLAHILINQLVFECGYSTASLRERLYVSCDPTAPMAGLLIYTAAGDSEGTLGGLVRLGRSERLGPVMQRALGRASWCSADPVCSEQLGGQGSQRANLAACHACILLPETSCETINQGLDRAMVVGTPDDRDAGIFAALLTESYSIG